MKDSFSALHAIIVLLISMAAIVLIIMFYTLFKEYIFKPTVVDQKRPAVIKEIPNAIAIDKDVSI